MGKLKLYPDIIRIETAEGKWIELSSENHQKWHWNEIVVYLEDSDEGYKVNVSSSSIPLMRIRITWRQDFPADTKLLGDAFERGYGDLGFDTIHPERIMPWYFMAVYQNRTECFGVMTGPNALCSWQVHDHEIDLWMDIRNGTGPLQLHDRVLEVATIVIAKNTELDPFEVLTAFCKQMCPHSNLPSEPIYGGNDWYYAYGNNTEALILEHARLISQLSQSNAVKPFMVIDDGWQVEHSSAYNGGPWHQGNGKFGSMQELASQIKGMNVRPGIWFRPLLTQNKVSAEQVLHSDSDKSEYILDISHPEVLAKVAQDIDRLVEWGFELIKHDFTTVDIFGKWGKDMDLNYTDKRIDFYDKTLTTAEIIKKFYMLIEEKSKGAYIIGCNTVSHLAAGIFAIQRTGDDTSGTDFNRTRTMGVNTLAYRMPQHNSFYLSDADCVGITSSIPWEQNLKWLKVLSGSGTPLFISCNPKELTEEMTSDLQRAFQLAASHPNPAIPVDWLHNRYPSLWKTDQGLEQYNWFSDTSSQ